MNINNKDGSTLPKLSVVIPVYRDELSIHENFLAVKQVLDSHREEYAYEIILVNDGSPDKSLFKLEEIRHHYPEITGVVNLTRNFGQVAAILAGIQSSVGDCVVVISSDLQDPPELIPTMFEKWRNGVHTVIGTRSARDDPWKDTATSRIFYYLLKRYGLTSLPESGFDFFLIDRTVAQRLVNSRERNSFLQGQIISLSGSISTIPYERRPRRYGKSGWTFLKKLKYFADAFTAFSFTPIRLIFILGVFFFLLGTALSVFLVIQRLVYGTKSVGWSSVMISMLMLHGVEMLMLGVLGEYVWRTLDQVRERPLYTIDYQKLPTPASGPVQANWTGPGQR